MSIESGGQAGTGPKINLIFPAGTPLSFIDTAQATASMLEAAIHDDITMNVNATGIIFAPPPNLSAEP